MKVAITGTPGTGKSSVARELEKLGFRVWRVEDLAKRYECILTETDFEEIVVDIERLKSIVKKLDSKVDDKVDELTIIEGHLSHHLADVAIVLRCNPLVLKERLLKRGWKREKVIENVEAELIDVILVEALDSCKRVYEIDTTKKSVEEVTSDILLILNSKLKELKEFMPGKIDWISAVGDKIDEIVSY